MKTFFETNFKILVTTVILLTIFLSCNNSINNKKPRTSSMNSKNSMVAIETVNFKSYNKRTKEFIPNRESHLKYNSQGGTIEANYFRVYSKEKSIWSNHQAKYSANIMTEYTVKRGDYKRKTKYQFDFDGKVLSTINLDWKDGNFIPSSREIFEYKDSLLVTHKFCSSMEDECKESSRYKHEYDSLGRKVTTFLIPNADKDTVRYFYEGTSGIPVKVTKFPNEYDILIESGKVTEIKKSYFDHYSQKMAIEKTTTIEYDTNDRVILIKEKMEHETEDSEYKYDDQGNLAEMKYSTRSRMGINQTKWVFDSYQEYSNFVTPAWFAETGLFWFKPKFNLDRFIGQLSLENFEAKVITSKKSFPSGYTEYWSNGQDKNQDKLKVDWVPYQKVEYKLTEL